MKYSIIYDYLTIFEPCVYDYYDDYGTFCFSVNDVTITNFKIDFIVGDTLEDCLAKFRKAKGDVEKWQK